MIKQPDHLLAIDPIGRGLKDGGKDMQWSTDGLLLGERRFGFPFLAATVKTNMGPARHALSQMVVCGMMQHQPPVRVVVEKE